MPKINVPVGELFDRISILCIKLEKIGGVEIAKELDDLYQIAVKYPDGFAFLKELDEVNRLLWETGDRLRELERERDFGDEFIALAREWVYMVAEKRHSIKRKIDEACDSRLRERKKYADWS